MKIASKKNPTESAIQRDLFEWAAYNVGTYPQLQLMFHIPNGGSRDPREAHNLKLQGVKAGVPDIFIPVTTGAYHGLFIELKRENGGRVSENQKAWIDALNQQGYKAIIAHGFDEAKAAIEEYLKA